MLRLTHFNKVKCQLNLVALSARKCNSTSVTGVKEADTKVTLPKRIHRRPTDVLYALAATVGTDPTAPHYKFHDDPFLIPKSNSMKRNFIMSKEAGKKAAEWIRKEYGQLFQHNNADPPIEAYRPPMIYNEQSDVNLKNLEESIKSIEVEDSILIYKLLQAKKVEVPAEVKQKLLELVAFYNHENTLSEDLIEEKMFNEIAKGNEITNKWKHNDLAEQLFEEMEPKTAAAYNAIIRGMCKHHESHRGYGLYSSAIEKGIPLDVDTFNSVLYATVDVEKGGQLRWELVLNILGSMNDGKVKPNLHTLNAILFGLGKMGIYKLSCQYALQTLAEFKKLGIEPSLGSYYFVLTIFCKDRAPTSAVLVDILNYVEGKEWKAQAPADQYFFGAAMTICRKHLNDIKLARRVDALLHLGNNYNLIGNTHRESVYYRNYMGILLESEPMNVFMDTYNYLVPNITSPEVGIMTAILDTVDASCSLEYLPKLWSDIVVLNHTNRGQLMMQILNIMAKNKPMPEIDSHAGLDAKFAIIAWDIWSQIESVVEGQYARVGWTGDMLSNELLLFCRAGDFEKAQIVFKYCVEKHSILTTTILPDALDAFVKLCIVHAQPSQAIEVLQYSVENSTHNTDDSNKSLATLIVSSFTLNEDHLTIISRYVGNDIVNEANA